MLIDWFTVGAQALNFVVLVWLMKRFLYGPILAAIAAREKRVADELAGADRQRTEARAATDALATRSATFDRDRESLMATARSAAQAEGVRLVDAARAVADTLTAQRRERLAAGSGELEDLLRRRTLDGVFVVVRKVLSDLASTRLEASVCDVFAGRLRALDDETRAALAAAMSDAGGVGLVRTAFDLPEPERAVLRRTVDEVFTIASTLAFETMPALVCGIELAAGGHKVSWNVADELSVMSRGIVDVLQAEALMPVPAS